MAALVWLACLPARASGPTLRVHVAVDACPDAALLKLQLEPLLGPEAVLTFDANELGRADAGHAAVSNLGERYVVEINGLRRELDDAARG